MLLSLFLMRTNRRKEVVDKRLMREQRRGLTHRFCRVLTRVIGGLSVNGYHNAINIKSGMEPRQSRLVNYYEVTSANSNC